MSQAMEDIFHKFNLTDKNSEIIDESEFYGNRTYWHGSHSPQSDTSPSIIDKLNAKGNYDEIYFSTHFGYSMSYAFRVAEAHKSFKFATNGNDLANKGKIEIQPPPDVLSLLRKSIKTYNENQWMILFKIKNPTNIFHAFRDLKILFVAMGSSKNPKIQKFLGTIGTKERMGLEEFFKAMEPLKTIDWISEIPKHFPFDRKELLNEIRSYNVGGRYVFHGYVNCEKGEYASIGLFNEHLKDQLLVGPLYRIKINNAGTIIVAKHGNSVNASISHDSPPNSMPLS